MGNGTLGFSTKTPELPDASQTKEFALEKNVTVLKHKYVTSFHRCLH